MIHRTIVGDLRRLLDGNSGRDKAKCKLQDLRIGHFLPLKARGEDIETVVKGFKLIFPSLADYRGGSQWASVQAGLNPQGGRWYYNR